MDLTCTQCHSNFTGAVSLKEDGWYSTCPACSVPFKVNLPAGKIVMAFVKGFERHEELFTDNFTGQEIDSYYAFDNVKDFYAAWERACVNREGTWYWVMDNGKLIHSGACSPSDIKIFVCYFGVNFNPNTGRIAPAHLKKSESTLNTPLSFLSIVKDFGAWYGKISIVDGVITIDNREKVFVYNSPVEAATDWVYTLLQDDCADWKDELDFLFSNGIKVTGLKMTRSNFTSKCLYTAYIDYSNGVIPLSAGTFSSAQDAYAAYLDAVKLRSECMSACLPRDDFRAKLIALKTKS